MGVVMLIAAATAGAGSLRGVDVQGAQELAALGGSRGPAAGPLGFAVPVEFYTKSLRPIISTQSKHQGSVKVNLASAARRWLLIDRPSNDGKPFPVIIALELGDGSFRNYIAAFDKNGRVLLALDDELSSTFAKLRNEGVEQAEDAELHILSEVAFEAILVAGQGPERSITPVRVTAPAVLQSYGPVDSCCLVTQEIIDLGGGQTLVTPFILVEVVNDDSGVPSFGYVRIWRTTDPVNQTSFSVTYRAYLELAYPDESTVLHRTDYSQPSYCVWRTFGTQYCSSEPSVFYSVCPDDPPGSGCYTRLRWWDMRNVALKLTDSGGDPRPAHLERYWSDCGNEGLSWTMYWIER